MKISAMKKGLLLCIICAISIQSKAQFNFSFTDGGVPVVGLQLGVVGGGHSALLVNKDDIENPLVTPSTMNFTYFTGVEAINWFQPHFGYGIQATLWNAGAAYTGQYNSADDSPTFNSTTSLSYAKVPVLFWYKSYNRWHPDRRIRVNTFFGPYFAMLVDGKETIIQEVPNTDIKNTAVITKGSYLIEDKDGVTIFDGNADDTSPFKTSNLGFGFDWGFTMGAGVEFRLWTKTVIGLTVRTDLGMSEVENKEFEVDLYQGNGTRYQFYNQVAGKYLNPAIAPDNTFIELNRPETRNMTFGAQLSIRKYFGAK